jgi:GT2 family glycosyltransferase
MIAVIIATTGRASLIRPLLERLLAQTRPPDWILLAPARAGDLPEGLPDKAVVLPCVVGLASQRNMGLDWCAANTTLLSSEDNMVVFFDDDFVPRDDWLDQAARLFHDRPDVAGLTGRLLADGVKGPGLTHADADALLAASARGGQNTASLQAASLYGCNMAVRASVVKTLRFDEMLPLYAWQEDFDYSQRVARVGPVVQADTPIGVHLGVKGGRVSGLRFGYSQIANPLYLLSKGTMGPRKMLRLIGGNIAANLAKTPRPEPHVDRLGRLRGNAMAFRDLLLGRLDPRKITQM